MKRASVRVTFLSAVVAVLGLLLCSPRVEAQITVPSSTLPVPGDTLRMSVDISPGACVFSTFTPPGGPQNWDLSCLAADANDDTVYRPASEGSVVVPGATMFAVRPATFPSALPTAEEYYRVNNGTLEILASYGRFLGALVHRAIDFRPPFAVRYSPLNFFDIRLSASNILEGFVPQEAPFILTLVPTADSVRYRLTYQESAVVDAFGQITIPGGTFDVLREKRTQYRSFAVDVKVSPLGWIDISTIGGQQFMPLGTDTITHFNFYNAVSKEPIASLEWNTAQNAVLKATYKRVQPVCQNDGDPCGDQSSSACNLPDTCQAGVCVSNLLAAGTACGSGANNACTSPDTCDGAGACVANDKPNGTACTDNNACTSGDSCQNGTCTVGAPVTCNDNNTCTNDSCNPATGCVFEPNNACTPPISVLSAVQQVESCSPANGVLDPGERVTYAITLRNNGTQPTTNLVATMLPSAGVSSPSGAQSYGVIPAGGSATRSFTWTGIGACGAAWSASLALTDSGQAVPAVTVNGSYGTPGGVCNTGCAVVRVTTRATLARAGNGSVVATVTVSNGGSLAATNVMLTSALLGTSAGTPASQLVAATLPPGESRVVTVTFPSTVAAGANVLRFGGTYTGSTFSSSLRVTVP